MIVERLELSDFRNYAAAAFDLTAGTTVVVGDNGQGKTNLAEAIAYLATLSSFRGAPNDALVRVGASSAIVRASLRDGGAVVADRGRAAGDGARPGAGEPPAPRPVPRSARRGAGERVRPGRPHPRQGRPVRSAGLPRRHPGGAGGEVRRRPPRARPHRAPAQHAAAPGRRAARRRRGGHPRRVGRQAGRRRRAVRSRPGGAGRAGAPVRRVGLRGAGRRVDRR